MSFNLKPIPSEAILGTVGVLLQYLESSEQSTPNNLLDGIVSAKSLCRALLAGDLVVCGPAPEEKKPAPRKKTPRKKPAK